MPAMTPGHVLRFESFELDPFERRLLVRGEPAVVGARAFDLLVALAEKEGEIVSKDQLLDRVWPKLVVTDNNIHVHVSALRKLLGDQAIGTLPGRGYRLAARRLSGRAWSDATAGAAPPATCVPRQPADMFGRADELAMLARLLRKHRLVSIVGPGGVGKSMLAGVAARANPGELAGNARWLDLHALAEASLLPDASALAGTLRGGCATLVLDGAEHLLDAVAQFAAAVLDEAPAARLLVTSRSPLRLEGERVLRIDPLPVPPADADAQSAAAHAAVALFAGEAQAADQRFALGDANVAAVVDICRQLDGLPLAIRLAAQRAHALGLPALRAHVPDHLHLLRNTSRGAPARHRSLQASLEWSLRLLDETQRAVLDRLAGLEAAFSLDRATQAAAGDDLDPWTVVETLAALVDRSLVQLDAQALDGYRLLAGVRCLVRRLAANAHQND